MSTSSTITHTLRRDSEGNEKEGKPALSAEVDDDTTAQEDLGNISGAEDESDELDYSENDEVAHEAEQAKPRIGYRVEYRNRWTNEFISHRTHDGTHAPDINQTGNPIFEVVTSYKVLADTSVDLAVNSLALPTYSLRIHSVALINAIQSVVRYYPGQDLSGEYINIPWPYPVLVHHFDELQQFRQDCLSKVRDKICIREINAAEHLRILLQYLEEQVMRDVREEQERNKRGLETFDWAWVPRKPGLTLLIKGVGDVDWHPMVVHSLTGGTLDNPPSPWRIRTWELAYNGYVVKRVWSHQVLVVPKYDGEREMLGYGRTKVFDPTTSDQFLSDEAALELIQNGKRFAEMLKPRCYQHRGETASRPPIILDGLVMVDFETQYADFPGDCPQFMGEDDLRNWVSDCTCDVCHKRKQDRSQQKRTPPLFLSFGGKSKDFSTHELLLMPTLVTSYVFRTRNWEDVRVHNLHEPEFNENMISHLVMSESRLKTLKALSKGFTRVAQTGEVLTQKRWSADFVRGKGNGLIFLLHGKPGVGKTCTAECIAEFTRRPLMILTTSDIGTEPAVIEDNLTRNFKKAMKWGAVLLIDEADVFMERRTTSDLTRNSLVAGFLRALEYYDGILFLTTNRVGSFDDAFISRIHIQLYYPDFSDNERQKVWKTFIDKLARERGETIRLTIDAKEYIESTRMQGLKWNGREIRNAFQTAVALAEYEADKDSEGRTKVKDDHLKAVVDLSKDFKSYLNDLHRKDEGKRAEQRYERLDSFEGSKQVPR
ncbi:P-loop containing nucleoside triphosphate hydrolase (ATPase) [Colletotrichum kahawae]|uniref:P-loop containing nucleoside triphosphate hydrolase (ATPase) n=1 Tax=Colletotrichum kahawae TaxID=34407 RepID=A0AAE0DCN9_COLKA|nr:P-loop containing nucleoside triphosphate hydrolase (ATPase) [Colletotrichum kahawae]